MADALERKEQQAIIRVLNDFKEVQWPAFQRRGFETIGQAFTAYLLMQLVSAKGSELAVQPTLSVNLAKPLSAYEELEARAVKAEPAPKEVLVGG